MAKSHTPETFVIYRSSAGSGKTWRLAVEYIALCVTDPSLYGKVLAVTFTNKATREMKERILDFLDKLAENTDEALRETIHEMTGLPGDMIAENARLAMKNILHGYSRFSVSTIDAFFQKVVKSFARELGLLGNFTVELDQVKIMQEVIDRIIGELDEEKELTEWMVDFSYQNIDESRSWNIRPQIEKLAGEVFRESFGSVSNDLLKTDTARLKGFLKEIRTIRTKFEKYQKDLAIQAKGLMEDYGLSVEDFSGKSRGPAAHYDKILKNKFEPTDTLRRALDEPAKWAASKAPRASEIEDILEAGLLGLTQNLVDHYDDNFMHYVTAGEVLRNFHVYGILRKIIDELKRYRREHDVMLISDVPVFLQKIIAENDAPFIYEKTGTWYRHFLIDEFQDTSRVQWNNFKPLIINGLSQGYKSLLVGDGKQSIYRWRGGDWSLILHKVREDLASWHPAERTLDTNWRSCRKVVQFNNTVFSFVPPMLQYEFVAKIGGSSLSQADREALEQMAGDVVSLYGDAVQNVADKNLDPSRGGIEIVAYEKNDEISWKEQVLDDLPKVIERLQGAGMQARDIAVLVRTAEDGRKVIEKLISHKKSPEAHDRYCYDPITSESLYLGNAPVVRLLVNLVRHLQNGDQVALAEVCFNYSLITSKEGDDDIKEFGDLLSEDVLPEGFLEEVQTLIRLPLYEMNEQVIRLLGLGGGDHREYLQVYQDAVREFFANDNRDIRDFLEWWEEKGSRISVQIPGSVNAIRVMTIHKSKGLEFRAVLIPFADWLLDNDTRKENILWCRTDEEPYGKMGFLPVKYSGRLADTFFARDYFEEMIRAHIDNLNLLYVALTRAEEFLLVNCPPEGKSMRNAGDALRKVLEGAELPDAVTEERHENKTIFSIGTIEGGGEAMTSQEEEMMLAGYSTSEWRERLAIRRRGGIFTRESRDKVHYGLLAHEVLANIDREEELEPLLAQYEREGKITAENHRILMEQLQSVFANPEVKKWFATGWEVKREASVIMIGAPQKRPDRVMIKGDRAVIVDFKTGAEKEADKRQVAAYRNLLQQMGYARVEAWLLYIGLNKVIKVA